MMELESYLRRLERENGFSGSVLVSIGDEVISASGYGFSNFQHGVKNTTKSKFCVASITKQFTAAAIFLLIEDGSLKPTDQLIEYLPKLPITWSQVSIIQLLTHTSGIPDFLGFVDWNSTGKYFHSPMEIVGLVADKAMDFPAGSRYSYCGTGYLILGMLIEVISGLSYSEFLQRKIFEKFQLNDTGIFSRDLVLPNFANGYEVSGGKLVNEAFFDMSFAFAAGDMYSTVEDLHRWSTAFFSGEVVGHSSLQEMISPSSVFYGYGCGLEIGQYKGGKVVGHKGGIGSFSSVIQNYLQDDMKVILLSNVESDNFPEVDEIATELVLMAMSHSTTKGQ